MSILNTKGYSYNDVTIIPSIISDINSRSECNPFVDSINNLLPIFTAPMASVVNEGNLDIFLKNGIIPIVPRNIDIERRKYLINKQRLVALSLKEFEDLFITNAQDRQCDSNTHYFICVDIANGHMNSLYTKCAMAKELSNKLGYKLTISAKISSIFFIVPLFKSISSICKQPLVNTTTSTLLKFFFKNLL